MFSIISDIAKAVGGALKDLGADEDSGGSATQASTTNASLLQRFLEPPSSFMHSTNERAPTAPGPTAVAKSAGRGRKLPDLVMQDPMELSRRWARALRIDRG